MHATQHDGLAWTGVALSAEDMCTLGMLISTNGLTRTTMLTLVDAVEAMGFDAAAAMSSRTSRVAKEASSSTGPANFGEAAGAGSLLVGFVVVAVVVVLT